MSFEPGSRIPHGPPQPRASLGDILFAFAMAAVGLALAATLLVVGGGGPLILALVSGGAPGAESPGPAAESPVSPGPAAAAERAGPIVPAAATSPEPATQPPAPASPSPSPTATENPATAAPEATPAAVAPFSMSIYREGVFVHQVDKESCEAAAIQNILNLIRLREEGVPPDTSGATQREIYARVTELTTWEDSHNGGTGPLGWAAYLTEQGYPYELRLFPSRLAAMRAAATALRATGRPVGVLAWQGVHSWVLTGFTASADPASARMFTVTTADFIDPWYPWVSTRWPRSEPPNAPRDAADLLANLKPYKLGSGPYVGRDGMYVIIAPLEP